MSSHHIEQFRAAIQSAGLPAPDEIHDDGTLHRFSTNGKAADLSGWYCLHSDGVPAGVFGCWRSGLQSSWCSKSTTEMTPAERDAHRQRTEAMQAQRAAEQAQRQQEAAQSAAELWAQAEPAPAEHPYLERKGIQPHGARVFGEHLLIPLRDTAGALHSLQSIAPDGSKRFHAGGRVKGCYHSIGKPAGVLVVCEGFATGASIHECTGHAVAVAFNAGNLLEVAQALHGKYPGLQIIVAADDDWRTDGNPGLVKATEAARAVTGKMAVPIFSGERPDKATDFNDLHALEGAAVVRECLDSAINPIATGAGWQGAGAGSDPFDVPDLPTTAAGSEDEPEGAKDSLSSQLVAFVLERCELFHDESGDAFALVHTVQETYRLTSTKFKSWLMAEFYKASGKAARDQSVREAMQVLDGLAQHDGEQKPVHIRVAQVDGAIYVDLAQPGSSMAAKIEAGQWALVQDHPVRFLRPDTMRPLPMPVVGAAGMDALWQFVNVPQDARLLVLAWLLECLRPDGVFPVLELLGEAGSAKSTTQRYLRMLIDPNASNLRSPPKSTEDVLLVRA